MSFPLSLKSIASIPAPPCAYRLTHDELSIRLAEPVELLCKHSHALAPRTRHLRDIRAPEHSVRTEGVIDLP